MLLLIVGMAESFPVLESPDKQAENMETINATVLGSCKGWNSEEKGRELVSSPC